MTIDVVTVAMPVTRVTVTQGGAALAVTQTSGPTGPAGAAGEGVPDGGTTGQILAKASADDYDTEWVSGGAGGVESDPVFAASAAATIDTDDISLWNAAVAAAATAYGWGNHAAAGYAAAGHDHSGVYEPAGTTATHAAVTTGVHGLAITAGQTLTVTTGGTLGTAAYTASGDYATAGHNHSGVYEPAGATATHAALTTGVHGLAITAGQTLTVTTGGTLGTAAYTASGDYAAAGHNHSGVYSPVGHDHSGVYLASGTKLDDLAAPDDNTDLNATVSSHGLLPKLGGGTTNFLRADGTWAAPAGGAHDAVTLAASADTVLSLSNQEIALDTQTANYVWAGPVSGGAAAPAFRALVAGDVPDLSSVYATAGHNHAGVYEVSGAVATHAALTTGVHGLGTASQQAVEYFALAGHTHSGVYSPVGHDHTGVYEPAKAGLSAAAIGITIDGGGSAITTGLKGFVRVPFACTIIKATLLADQSGSAVVDVWKDTYANAPPTDADSITASAPPTLSGAAKSEDGTLTGWTTSITAGDVLAFAVDSAATITRLTLILDVTKT